MLYCLLHSLDQHLTALEPDGDGATPTDGLATAAGVDGAAIDLPSSVSSLDFLDGSYQLVRLVSGVLHHQQASSASSSATSASTQVCQTRLTCFAMDWRQVWHQRFVCHWLQSTSLALVHPMLLECLWRMYAQTSREMQTDAIEGIQMREGEANGSD